MMKIAVLSSGSKGNCALIETDKTKILIDVGVTRTYIENALDEINVDPYDIKGILITHTHVDHIQGLKVFLKKYHPIVYVNETILSLLKETLEDFEYFIYDQNKITISDLSINVIKTSHDVQGSVGFVVKSMDKSLVYITDTGYINNKYFDILKNHNLYVLESNHDAQMLMEGKYPLYLKKRIISDKGHLSNDDASYFLSEFIGDKTSTIILAHLSDDNNTSEKALGTLNRVLSEKNKRVSKVIVAKQKKRTELIDV